MAAIDGPVMRARRLLEFRQAQAWLLEQLTAWPAEWGPSSRRHLEDAERALTRALEDATATAGALCTCELTGSCAVCR